MPSEQRLWIHCGSLLQRKRGDPWVADVAARPGISVSRIGTELQGWCGAVPLRIYNCRLLLSPLGEPLLCVGDLLQSAERNPLRPSRGSPLAIRTFPLEPQDSPHHPPVTSLRSESGDRGFGVGPVRADGGLCARIAQRFSTLLTLLGTVRGALEDSSLRWTRWLDCGFLPARPRAHDPTAQVRACGKPRSSTSPGRPPHRLDSSARTSDSKPRLSVSLPAWRNAAVVCPKPCYVVVGAASVWGATRGDSVKHGRCARSE